MTQSFDVLIVGGGVVGLTAALAMARCNYNVALIDAGDLTVKTQETDARVYAVNKASQTFLEQLEVWSSLELHRLSPYQKMHVWDGVNGAVIDFDARSIAEPYLGTIIEESVLKAALLKQIQQHATIKLFAHTAIQEVVPGEPFISISSANDSWHGRLLMIADGAQSPIRAQLKIPLTSWSYEQQAIVATVQTQKKHNSTAYQVFNSNGPLAFLPLVDEHQCSIVWSSDTAHAQAMMNLNEEEFNHALSSAFAHKLGAVTVLSTRYQFPLRMRQAQKYSGTRWLLLGDAAHTIHPLAGLGLNVGLADVACWYGLVKINKNALETAKALAVYQRARKASVWNTILLMEGFKRLFAVSFSPVAVLRGLGLTFCNQLLWLKRLFIEHAAGK